MFVIYEKVFKIGFVNELVREKMKLICIDECDKSEKKVNVLAAILIDHTKIIELQKEASDFLKNTELKSLKQLRRGAPFNRKKKLECIEALCKILDKYEVVIICCIFGDNSAKKLTDSPETYCKAVKFILERFVLHLHKIKLKGLLVMDSFGHKYEKKVSKLIYTMINEGSAFNHPFKKYIINMPLFIKDEHSMPTQIADLVALSIANAYLKCDKSTISDDWIDTLKEDDYLGYYWKLFDRASPDGSVKGYGIKHWD